MNILWLAVWAMSAQSAPVNERPSPPEGQSVFIPPDIRYWAFGRINTTVIDNLGLPWYCYTHRQTHCIPMFKVPPNFRTTRRPYTSGPQANEVTLDQIDDENDPSVQLTRPESQLTTDGSTEVNDTAIQVTENVVRPQDDEPNLTTNSPIVYETYENEDNIDQDANPDPTKSTGQVDQEEIQRTTPGSRSSILAGTVSSSIQFPTPDPIELTENDLDTKSRAEKSFEKANNATDDLPYEAMDSNKTDSEALETASSKANADYRDIGELLNDFVDNGRANDHESLETASEATNAGNPDTGDQRDDSMDSSGGTPESLEDTSGAPNEDNPKTGELFNDSLDTSRADKKPLETTSKGNNADNRDSGDLAKDSSGDKAESVETSSNKNNVNSGDTEELSDDLLDTSGADAQSSETTSSITIVENRDPEDFPNEFVDTSVDKDKSLGTTSNKTNVNTADTGDIPNDSVDTSEDKAKSLGTTSNKANVNTADTGDIPIDSLDTSRVNAGSSEATSMKTNADTKDLSNDLLDTSGADEKSLETTPSSTNATANRNTNENTGKLRKSPRMVDGFIIHDDPNAPSLPGFNQTADGTRANNTEAILFTVSPKVPELDGTTPNASKSEGDQPGSEQTEEGSVSSDNTDPKTSLEGSPEVNTTEKVDDSPVGSASTIPSDSIPIGEDPMEGGTKQNGISPRTNYGNTVDITPASNSQTKKPEGTTHKTALETPEVNTVKPIPIRIEGNANDVSSTQTNLSIRDQPNATEETSEASGSNASPELVGGEVETEISDSIRVTTLQSLSLDERENSDAKNNPNENQSGESTSSTSSQTGIVRYPTQPKDHTPSESLVNTFTSSEATENGSTRGKSGRELDRWSSDSSRNDNQINGSDDQKEAVVQPDSVQDPKITHQDSSSLQTTTRKSQSNEDIQAKPSLDDPTGNQGSDSGSQTIPSEDVSMEQVPDVETSTNASDHADDEFGTGQTTEASFQPLENAGATKSPSQAFDSNTIVIAISPSNNVSADTTDRMPKLKKNETFEDNPGQSSQGDASNDNFGQADGINFRESLADSMETSTPKSSSQVLDTHPNQSIRGLERSSEGNEVDLEANESTISTTESFAPVLRTDEIDVPLTRRTALDEDEPSVSLGPVPESSSNDPDDFLHRVLSILNDNKDIKQEDPAKSGLVTEANAFNALAETEDTTQFPLIDFNSATDKDEPETTTDDNSLLQRNRNPKQSGPECKSCGVAIEFSDDKEGANSINEIDQEVIVFPGDRGYHWKYEVDDDHILKFATTFQPQLSSSEQSMIPDTTSMATPVTLNINEVTSQLATTRSETTFDPNEATTITPNAVVVDFTTDAPTDITTDATADFTTILVPLTVETTQTPMEPLDTSTASEVVTTFSVQAVTSDETTSVQPAITLLPTENDLETTSPLAVFNNEPDTAIPMDITTTIMVEDVEDTTTAESETTTLKSVPSTVSSDDLLNVLLFDVGDIIANEAGESTTPNPTLRPEDTPVLAQAYTVFGEKCNGTCEDRGYSYTWCYKLKPSRLGTWTDSDYCSTKSGVTPYGESCIDACEKRGYDYYWCRKSSLWGYCVPEHLLEMSNTWKALFGEPLPYAEEFKDVAPAPAFTIYGKPCLDECDYRKEEYTYCTKANPQDTGTWTRKDYCTNNDTVEVSHEGVPCNDDCLRRQYSYFWCHTNVGFGYCTPKVLIQRSFQNVSLASRLNQDPESVNLEAINPWDELEQSRTDELEDLVATKAFTVHGEPCRDECSNYDGSEYTWCHKIDGSTKGTWYDGDFCTHSPNVTHYNQPCLDECEKRDQEYFWCHKELALWGFCTPQFLLDQLNPERVN